MRILPRLEVITPSDLLLPAENLIVPEVTVPRKGLKTRAFELLKLTVIPVKSELCTTLPGAQSLVVSVSLVQIQVTAPIGVMP